MYELFALIGSVFYEDLKALINGIVVPMILIKGFGFGDILSYGENGVRVAKRGIQE